MRMGYPSKNCLKQIFDGYLTFLDYKNVKNKYEKDRADKKYGILHKLFRLFR